VEQGCDCSDLARAQGKLVLFLASVLQSAGGPPRDEFGRLLAVFAESVSETSPDEGAILAGWADLVAGVGANGSSPAAQ
jgi:hypothetical protein